MVILPSPYFMALLFQAEAREGSNEPCHPWILAQFLKQPTEQTFFKLIFAATKPRSYLLCKAKRSWELWHAEFGLGCRVVADGGNNTQPECQYFSCCLLENPGVPQEYISSLMRSVMICSLGEKSLGHCNVQPQGNNVCVCWSTNSGQL